MFFAFAGGVAGFLLGLDDAPWLGAVLGAAIGHLYSRVDAQQQKLDALERAAPRAGEAPASAPSRPAAPDLYPGPAPTALGPTAAAPTSPAPTPAAPAPSETLKAAGAYEPPAYARAQAAPPQATAHASETAAPAAPGALERAFEAARAWLLTGNVPVKVGVIVSFFGVAFLLKYAVDEGLLSFPIEFRLIGVAAGAIAMLAVGWRLRARERTYALTMQGGGVAILYLTAFAAFRLYHLLPPALAFAFLVLLTVGVAALAVLQRSQVLAVAGIVGGFMAPVLASTGTGSHVALFSYYLLLNGAIAAIAWHMAWRPLNWLGFVFTFVIGTTWGYQYYKPEHFATVEPFLIASFLLYVFIATTFALRHGPKLKGYVDGTLIFGLPLAVFALQWQLVKPWEMGQAQSALALALFYVGLATVMFRRASAEARLLAECFIALGVGFATIAIPLALDARWTSASWALEGAGLIWVAVRQGRVLSRWSGVTLVVLAALTLVRAYPQLAVEPLLLNGRFMGGMILALGSGLGMLMLERGPARHADGEKVAAFGLLAIAMLAWYMTGWNELWTQVAPDWRYASLVLFVAASAFAIQRLGIALASAHLVASAVVVLPLLGFLALRTLGQGTHPAADHGWLAWPLALSANLAIGRALTAPSPAAARAVVVGGLWIAGALLAREAYWQLGQLAPTSVWPWAAAILALALTGHAVANTRLSALLPEVSTIGAGALVSTALLVAVAMLLGSRGSPAPLPYFPLANPLDLALLLAGGVFVAWWGAHGADSGVTRGMVVRAAFALGFLLVTMDAVRYAHHWDAMPFRFDAALRHDGLQAALSIVWATLGVAAMLLGARLARRVVWMAGAALMAVVVGKLFLIDLGNTGTVARIVSFIGVGLLLLVIGYLAPLPARAPEEAAP